MAIKLPNGDILRNLEEQVQKNKEDIQRHYEIERVLADWGIRIIGQMEEWEIPTGSFQYGDAYAVGPDGGPFVFYIYTRGNPDYWFDYGAISIVGPAGPQGPKGEGEKGERGSKWYIGSNIPTGPDVKEGDMWLQSSTGNIYIFTISGSQNWSYAGNIIGPQGIPGPEGKTGPQGPSGPQGPRGERGYTTITRIIGSLPEGSVISDTYNPAEQPENATVLMPVNGETHAFVIIDGVWTDAGPYSGGSAVYANGEYQQTFDADTKLDKIAEATASNVYVYTTDYEARVPNKVHKLGNNNGNYVAYNIPMIYGSTSGSGAVGGYLLTNTPKNAYHCANKQYVDNKIAQEHGKVQHTVLEWFKGQPLQFTVDMGVYINPSMPTMPSNFQLYGIGGYVLNNGSYYSNGPATNELSFSMTDFKATQTSYYPGGNSGSITAQFTINDYTINGTVATFILTADDFGPEGGIMTFDCVPHSPNNL